MPLSFLSAPLFDSVTITLLVARAENGAIGKDNQLIWKIKADMAHFKAYTMGKPIVMGRKTFQSLPKALPGRENIIITRDRDFTAANIFVHTNPLEALAFGVAMAQKTHQNHGSDPEICVIGGAEIYAQTLPYAHKILVTEVAGAPDADAFFPDMAKDPNFSLEATIPLDTHENDSSTGRLCSYIRCKKVFR